MRVEYTGNFKSNASLEFPEGRMLFLQRFARFTRLDGGNRPLGEREGEEKEREAASVRKNELEHFNDPLFGIYWMVLPSKVSGLISGVSGCLEYPNRGPEYPAHPDQNFSEG
jgi:hypothetical protein